MYQGLQEVALQQCSIYYAATGCAGLELSHTLYSLQISSSSRCKCEIWES